MQDAQHLRDQAKLCLEIAQQMSDRRERLSCRYPLFPHDDENLLTALLFMHAKPKTHLA